MRKSAMGFFSLFGKKSTLEVDIDGVWMTKAAKYSALKAAAEGLYRDSLVLVLTHFQQIRREVEEVLQDLPDVEELTSEGALASRLTRPVAGVIGIARADWLPNLALEADPASAARISVLAADRYPLRERDDAIESALQALPWRSTLKFYLSLDDAVLAQFGVQQIRDLLVTLGMGENDEVTNPTVNRAIENAQKKFRKKAKSDVDADSAEDWFRFNLE